MKLDAANRAFLPIAAVGLAAVVLGAGLACGLLGVVLYRLGAHGLDGLVWNGRDLRPVVVVLAVVGTGAVLGVLSIRRQLIATQSLAARVREHRVGLSGPAVLAARDAGLLGRVVEVDDPEPFSFTYGLVRPRIVLSRGLAASLDRAELDAVLVHERYHVRSFDPLKVVAARAVPAALFFLPILRDLRARYLAGRELVADRAALTRYGQKPLAGALYKAAAGWDDLGPAAALRGSDFLEARISQLETGRPPEAGSFSALTVIGTAAAAAVVLVAIVAGAAAGAFSMMAEGGMMRMGPTEGDRGEGAVGVILSLAFWGWVVWELRGLAFRPRRRTTTSRLARQPR